MRRMNSAGLVIFLAILLLVEYYAFTAFRFAIRSMKPGARTGSWITYGILTAGWYSLLLLFNVIRQSDMDRGIRNALLVFFMGFLIAKLLIALFLLMDDFRRLLYWVGSLFFSSHNRPQHIENGMTRSAFMTRLALLMGGTFFATLLHGMSNRYNYRLRKVNLRFPHLPADFHQLKIIQISDIHSGSLTDPKAVAKGIEMILAQQPDLILFTGDLVNNKSEEMDEYIALFSKLKAPLGVYSILGNHDYGDYVEWESPLAKSENLNRLKAIHAQMGWNLLLNEHVVLRRGESEIALLGVENISAKGFHSYGNLKMASTGTASYPFQILMSHDPSHWDAETIKSYQHIDLTLSGHTHGMQFGVEIPWLKWSPVQYAYPRWAGLYQEGNQYLYINRGFGFLGYPGRVGILPEITMITLEQKTNPA